jgi:hypothetical protein
MLSARLDQAEELEEEVRKLWASGIGAGWCGWGRISVEDVRRRFGAGGRREEDRGRNSIRMELGLVL